MKLLIVLSLTILSQLSFSQTDDWANLNKYKQENSEIGLPSENENRVVFMGNSITEGWIIADPDFFKENSFINRGISGQTTPQLLIRFRQDVVNLKPKGVVLLAGTNDIAGNTGPSSFEMIEDNIMSMVEISKANNIKVILCSVLPVFDYPWKQGINPSEKIIELNRRIKSDSEENQIIYADYFSAMADEKNGLKKRVF
ncbi:MAG: GDSL-type esterase/lipase family protein [Ignavibacteriaceae bacterium]|jgi:lysophospholipase L1-like esterase|nr:GDSL-type esterase/lipase family protein [Ignavibacteriaceae bacterium]